MKKIRAIIFNVIFQLALAILIIDFQTNPEYLRPKCLTGIDRIISPCRISIAREGRNHRLHRMSDIQ